MISRPLALGWLTLIAACADFERGVPSEDAGTGVPVPAGDGGEAVSFASAVHPLLTARCQGCHANGGSAGDTSFVLGGAAAADFTVASALVDTASPPLSRLLTKASGQAHGGGAIYAEGSPEYGVLLSWVSGGAAP